MGDFELLCLNGKEKVEEKYTLGCENGHKGLLRAIYKKKMLDLHPCEGIFKFYDWLPVYSELKTESAPIAFKNEKLNKELGLSNLWIGFTGYYPERNGKVKSCSFKEMEALPTYARLNDSGGGEIIVASAGNTARAFAEVAGHIDNKCVIVVPKRSGDRITVTKDNGNVRLFTVDGDYADSIQVADRMAATGGFVPEGGAKNIARRDGMGTVMLQGAISMNRIPDHYFQAVGSGTGGISAWEASLRLIGDGRYGSKLPTLNLAQNLPFTPMAKAWNAGRREITDEDLENAEENVKNVYADVLTNRKPPYSITGGLFDAMTECGGRFYEITNNEAISAEKLWMSHENVKPDPAASVAFASLIKAVENGDVNKDEYIFLNMTGGGLDRVREELDTIRIKPLYNLDKNVSDDEIRRILNE